MLGIFHGIHAAWNEATRDAPETKNDIKESLSKKKKNDMSKMKQQTIMMINSTTFKSRFVCKNM